MAAVSLPELPETPRTGAPDLPELPAPPLGGGRNGNDERDGVSLALFHLEQASLCFRAAGGMPFMARDCRDVRRALRALEGNT